MAKIKGSSAKPGVTINPGKKWYSFLHPPKTGENNGQNNFITGPKTKQQDDRVIRKATDRIV
jgi:hypothetical protein